MKQIFLPKYGPPEVLEVRQAEAPAVGREQVRVRVHAIGVNFADLLARMGLYREAPKPPCVLGFECSGVIEELGVAVAGLAKGDRVIAVPKFGAYTDELVVDARYVVRIPEALSFDVAAALPTVYLTAHHVMFEMGAPPEGATILVHGAAGGVGMAAVQLAKLRGYRVLGTASAGKHSFLREHGCDRVFEYAGWPEQVRAAVGDRGVALVLDSIGGRSWADSYAALAPGGRLVCLGASTNVTGMTRSLAAVARFFLGQPSFQPLKLMSENRQVGGFNLRGMYGAFDGLRRELEEVIALCADGKISPFVDKVFAMGDVAAAHRWLHERKAKGKLLLHP
ncbi:MAG: zinc-binding dehydrogenase [Kofleriaceae bacterium]